MEEQQAAIEQRITAYIVETLIGDRQAVVDPEENLFTGGYVDSVGIVRLIAHVESVFGVKVPPTDRVAENFRTVRTMAAYLARIRRPPNVAVDAR